MKREELKQIAELTDEQLDKIMAINGADVEKAKSKVAALEAENKEHKANFSKLNTEFEALKTANASGEDWKAKFEALQAENVAKEKQAEADRILREKNENIANRFSAVLGDKKFSHEAVREAYLKKFGDALDNADYQGKSDADIFHALTKDDAQAFTGITAVKLAGGATKNIGSARTYSSKEEIMSIKDRGERRIAIAENLNLFNGEK